MNHGPSDCGLWHPSVCALVIAIDQPDAATKRAYITEPVAIDPDIVHGKEDKAVNRGRDQCSSVKE